MAHNNPIVVSPRPVSYSNQNLNTPAVVGATLLGLNVRITNALPVNIVVIELGAAMLSMDSQTAHTLMGDGLNTSPNATALDALGRKLTSMRKFDVDNARFDLSGALVPKPTARDVPVARQVRKRVAGRVEMAQENMASLVGDMARIIASAERQGVEVGDAQIERFGQRYASMRGEVTQLRTAVTELEGAWETVQAQFVRMMNGVD